MALGVEFTKTLQFIFGGGHECLYQILMAIFLFTQNHKCQPTGGARGKVRGSPELLNLSSGDH